MLNQELLNALKFLEARVNCLPVPEKPIFIKGVEMGQRIQLTYQLTTVSPVGAPVKRTVAVTAKAADGATSVTKELEVSLNETQIAITAYAGWTLVLEVRTADAAGNVSEPAVLTQVVEDTFAPPAPDAAIFLTEQAKEIDGDFAVNEYIQVAIVEPEPDDNETEGEGTEDDITPEPEPEDDETPVDGESEIEDEDEDDFEDEDEEDVK
jgi:hypothetical protein